MTMRTVILMRMILLSGACALMATTVFAFGNGSFEQGESDWDFRKNGWFVDCDADAVDGACVAHYINDPDFLRTPLVRQSFLMPPGTYRFSAWIKTAIAPTPPGDRPHVISVQMWNLDLDRPAHDIGRDSQSEQDWTYYSKVIFVSQPTNCQVRLYAHRSPEGEAWVDDIRVTPLNDADSGSHYVNY